LGPLAGGIAATCSLKSFFDTWPIALFTLFWISGFDILYALKFRLIFLFIAFFFR
jgi:hypothetical protein